MYLYIHITVENILAKRIFKFRVKNDYIHAILCKYFIHKLTIIGNNKKKKQLSRKKRKQLIY